MATSKIDPDLLAVIQQEAERIANQVYENKGTKYGVAETPTHVHNNVDSVSVPAINIDGFLPLPATKGGVVSPTILGNQIVSQGNTTRGYGIFTTVGAASFPIYPIPVIYGNGAGISSAFNGGTAPVGSMVFFENGNTLSGLWVRDSAGWRRMATDGNPPVA